MTDPIYPLASTLLSATVLAFEADDRPLPERRFVSNGAVAFDECDQLAVEVTRIYVGLPALEQAPSPNVPAGVTRSVDMTVWLTRCVPVMDDAGDPPSMNDLDESAQGLLADGWAMFFGLLKARKQGTFGDLCQSLSIGPLVPHGPEGSQGGWRLTVQAQV